MTKPTTYFTAEQVDEVFAAFAPAFECVEALPASRERSLAITNLQQARMWALADLRVRAGGTP